MFKNIGTKIKNLVTVLVIISSLIFIIFGIYLIFAEESNTRTRIFGLIISIIGPLISWLSGFIMYGFGECVEKIVLIEKHLSSKNNENELKEILDTQLENETIEEEYTYSLEDSENNEDDGSNVDLTENHQENVIMKNVKHFFYNFRF